MLKKILLAVFIVLLLVAGYLFMPLQALDMYNTGFGWEDINNGETKHFKHGCNLYDVGCWYGQVAKDYSELIRVPMNNNPVVTEMTDDPGGDSVTISVEGNIFYVGPVLRYWEAEKGWYRVHIKYSPTGTWKEILNTGTGAVNSDIVSIVSGSMNKQDYTFKSYDIDDAWWTSGVEIVSKAIKSVAFKLKGSQVGILRVQQLTEFWAPQVNRRIK